MEKKERGYLTEIGKMGEKENRQRGGKMA